jgi:hypothetical protein
LNIISIDFLIQSYLVLQLKLHVNKIQIKNVIYTILCHLIQVELLVAVTVELNIMPYNQIIYIPKQINIKLIEVILKQHTHAMIVERLLDYIGQSKKDPSNVHNFLILR